VAETAWRNKLYYGDNLDVMRENIAPGSIHLVYLDPESDRTGVGESGQQEAG
jgi:DNA modification methylase